MVIPQDMNYMMTLFGKMSRPAAILSGFTLVGLIWGAEYWTGPEVVISIFYILPITLVVWRAGGPWSFVMPVICVIAWWTAEFASGPFYSHWRIGCLNASVRLGFFLIFARLITMRKHYLVEKTAREAAEEASRLKTNMISLVSHEYGNALTNMKLAMILLREGETATPTQSTQRAYAVLDRAITHLQVSTANFLNLNRIESGQFRLDIGRAQLRSVVRKTLEFLQPSIQGKRLRVELDFPHAPVHVRADPEALAIIMSNLITNAIKYTPEGGSIRIRIVREDGGPPRALLSVEDTGIGIAVQDQKRILSGFYRTKEGQELASGFGIGLSLIKDLLERHGTQLNIESAPGKGSRFYFHLPLCDEGPTPASTG